MEALSDPHDPPLQTVRDWLAAGERFDVEFKTESHGQLNDRDLVEAVVCLTNGAARPGG